MLLLKEKNMKQNLLPLGKDKRLKKPGEKKDKETVRRRKNRKTKVCYY